VTEVPASEPMKFLRTLLNCCAGFQYYRTLLSLHPLQSVKFLAAVILFVVIIQIGIFIPVLKKQLEHGAEWVQRTLPRFEVKNGAAHFDSSEPFVFTNNYVRIIVDTSGATNEPPYTRPYGLFIGRDKIQYGIAHQDKHGNIGAERKSQESLEKFPDGTVDAAYVRKLATPWLLRMAPYALLVYFFGWLLLVLIQAYLFTLVISLAESATLKRFGFNEFFNIAAHACAPAMVVVTALIVSRTLKIDWLLMAFLTTYFVYVMGATAACKEDEEERKDPDGV